MNVQRLLQRKSILSSTKQEFMTNDPSLAKCVMSSMLVTQTTTITQECINQRKKTRLLKCEKCYYETTHKQSLNRHILTVHNEKKDSNKSNNRSFPYCGKFSCNKDTQEDTQKRRRERHCCLLRFFALFDLFPYFLSPPQVRFNSLSRV